VKRAESRCCGIQQAEIYAGDAASMELYPSKEDPIGELPPFNSVLGTYILRGDMRTRTEKPSR